MKKCIITLQSRALKNVGTYFSSSDQHCHKRAYPKKLNDDTLLQRWGIYCAMRLQYLPLPSNCREEALFKTERHLHSSGNIVTTKCVLGLTVKLIKETAWRRFHRTSGPRWTTAKRLRFECIVSAAASHMNLPARYTAVFVPADARPSARRTLRHAGHSAFLRPLTMSVNRSYSSGKSSPAQKNTNNTNLRVKTAAAAATITAFTGEIDNYTDNDIVNAFMVTLLLSGWSRRCHHGAPASTAAMSCASSRSAADNRCCRSSLSSRIASICACVELNRKKRNVRWEG